MPSRLPLTDNLKTLEAASPHEGLITSIALIGEDGVVQACNSSAEDTLLGQGAVNHSFEERLSEAAKFGRISTAAISQIKKAIEAGSGAFYHENGHTFVVHSLLSSGRAHVEWTDVAAAVPTASDREPATGLLTRQGFIAALDEERRLEPTAVALDLDLDDFKEVNDVFGHATGDYLIRRISERIASHLDASKARLAHGFGGEFFLVVARDYAAALSAELLDIVARPYLIDGKMIHCTASIGMAQCFKGEDAETILRNAGLALKKSKAEGGNQAHIFTIDMREATERRRALEAELRKALALREFSLVFQPQYQIEGRQLIGFEALLRWNHPIRGAISPAEFIPLAEELGLIVPIGEWVLRTACKQAASWPSDISMSVNVSPLQFRSPAIVSAVVSALKNSGLEASRLDLEVTEGALLVNSVPVMDTFRQLKAIGVRFSMDDFGTGYSSLSYLQKFPFDKIKIDQSFVRSLSENKDSRSIIRAICALGKALGLTTIAEGVETEEQLAQIEKKGCQQVQGYLTGRPLTPELADQLVAAKA